MPGYADRRVRKGGAIGALPAARIEPPAAGGGGRERDPCGAEDRARSRVAAGGRRERVPGRDRPATPGGTGVRNRQTEEQRSETWLRTAASPTWARARSRCRTIDYPTFELQDGPGVNPANVGRKLPHGAILKIVATNICGSDQHMVRGRTTAPEGLILGPRDHRRGDRGRAGRGVHQGRRPLLGPVQHRVRPLSQLQGGKTGICLNVNPDRPGLGVRLRRHGRLGRRPGGVRRWCPTPTGTC